MTPASNAWINNKLMTSAQKKQFNQTPEKMRRDCKKNYGLDFEETIEMAYENIQEVAKRASKGLKLIS